jgi:hypothetical protein
MGIQGKGKGWENYDFTVSNNSTIKKEEYGRITEDHLYGFSFIKKKMIYRHV